MLFGKVTSSTSYILSLNSARSFCVILPQIGEKIVSNFQLNREKCEEQAQKLKGKNFLDIQDLEADYIRKQFVLLTTFTVV